MKTTCILLASALAVLGSVSSEAQTDSNRNTGKPKAESTITHVDAVKADKLVADKQVVVLDIRTPKEFAAGHIPGATNIDFYGADFEKKLTALDKERPCLVHCASGGRSTKSLEAFKKLGFKSIFHLDGGFTAWEKAGKPVEPPRSK